MVGLIRRLVTAWRRRNAPAKPDAPSARRMERGVVDHVVLLDGTLGALSGHRLTSIGLIYRYLRRRQPKTSAYYGQGVQFREWRDFKDIWLGWGVEAQICRAYGWLAMRYRPGDRIFLLGYSRGGFAARSLAGLIDRVGLLRAEEATERNVAQAWRHYQSEQSPAAFRHAHCHPQTAIEMVGVFDTVAALGLRLPFLWMLSADRVRFHDHRLGNSVRHGFHALALHETRSALEPLLWQAEGTGAERIEQVWFRGCHADIGGQLAGQEASRPLANIPLVWMLSQLERLGLGLPSGWREDFPADPTAPSIGNWRGWGAIFLLRAPRLVGRDPSERIHETAFVVPQEWWLTIRPWLAARRPVRGAAPSGGGAHDEAGGRAQGINPPVGKAANFAARDPG